MSNNDYKKRAKGNWNQGKGCKGDSEERMYAKKEIVEQVKVNDDKYLTPHKGKRKKNLKAQLEYRIAWYTQMAENEVRNKRSDIFTYFIEEGLKNAKKEYEEKYGKS